MISSFFWKITTCLNEYLNCSVFQEILSKSLLVFKVSPFDFGYCVILIYRLKVGDRAGDGQVTFSFHLSCVGGQYIFTIEKVLMGIKQILHWFLVLGHMGFIFNLPCFDSCGE